MNIPLFNCRLDDSVVPIASSIFASGDLASGKNVTDLEQEIASYLGHGHSVAIGDLTNALQIALRLVGVSAGDDVLTLAFNCMSSNIAIALVGAKPVWIDIEPTTLSIDMEDIARAITPKTRALVAYSVAGYPQNYIALRKFCKNHNIAFIDDANNAFGARQGGLYAGTAGDIGVLSFYANRQINAIEGAMLICGTIDQAHRAKRLRRFGIDTNAFRTDNGEIDSTYDISELGISSSLNNLNAGLALSGLRTVSQRLKKVIANVAELNAGIADIPALEPIIPIPDRHPVYWTWILLSGQRDALMEHLKTNGISCTKLHCRNDVYSGFEATARSLPGTDRLSTDMLALPAGWWLTQYDVAHILKALREFHRT